jgi:Mrp family chromosome partitioning ATPase
MVSAEQVEQALREQQKSGSGKPHVLLGLLMVDLKMITPAQFVKLLDQDERCPELDEDAIRLAARLRVALGEDGRMVLFTGVGHGEGTSSVASQAAMALSMMEAQPVLLADANFRRPRLHELLKSRPSPGLLELLAGKLTPEEASVCTGIGGLHLLPAGQSGGDFTSLVLSDRCLDVLKQLGERFRYVLFDAPPLLRYPEPGLLAARVGQVVAVAAAGRRSRSDFAELQVLLEGLHVRLLGVVLSQKRRRGRARSSR